MRKSITNLVVESGEWRAENEFSTLRSPLSVFAQSIAASDPTGGAGVQADLRTFEHFGVRGLSVITAITAQNSLGVSGVWPVNAETIEAQLNALSVDHDIRVVKIGALCSVEAVEVVADFLRNGDYTVVLDPVVNPTRGAQLTSDEAVAAMRELIFPLTTLLTPNIPEAELLLGRTIDSFDAMSEAGRDLRALGPESILIKGGHLNSDVVRDLYYSPSPLQGEGRGEVERWFESPRIEAELHGSGCTLASGIAAELAKGQDFVTSITNAREYVCELLSQMSLRGATQERRSNPHRIAETVGIASSVFALLAMTVIGFF